MRMAVDLAHLVNARYNFHCGNVDGKQPEDELKEEAENSPFANRSTSEITSARGSVQSSIRH